MNIFPNNNLLCPQQVAQPITPPVEKRRRLDGLQEGDRILVQTPSGICEQGVFIRIEDGFLIWARNIQSAAHIAITSLDAISITRI